MSELTHDDVKQIIALVDAAEHLDEIELEYGAFRLHLCRSGGGGAAVRPAPPPPAARPVPARPATRAEEPLAEGVTAVRSPMLGTFYRAGSPGEKPFTEIGARVKAGDTVCLIEVMKLFNSISAGVDGTVVGIAVEDGSLVEFNQAVILIAADKPADA